MCLHPYCWIGLDFVRIRQCHDDRQKVCLGYSRFVNWADKCKENNSTHPCTELYDGMLLIQSTNHFSSVESVFYNIKWTHQIAGGPDTCVFEMIKNIVEETNKK